ncbi:MAG: hypothetical protein ACRDRV_11025 [Pseudonocardiaceae bacterium]
MTARLEVLRRLTGERIAGERAQAEAEIAALSAESIPSARQRQDVATARMRKTHERYLRASIRPTGHQLGERRMAEDKHKRPDALVSSRRMAEHERAERVAAREYLDDAQQLHSAEHDEAVAIAIIQKRRAVARIRAVRLYEHGWRRCATYWQQLIRSHPEGPRLNGLLELVGPELPGWAREQSATENPGPQAQEDSQ